MAQETKIRATRDEYIDSMLDVAYMAAQLVDDTDLGRNPHPLVDVLRAKIDRWRSVRDDYLGDLGARYIRRPVSVHPVGEDLEPGVTGE